MLYSAIHAKSIKRSIFGIAALGLNYIVYSSIHQFVHAIGNGNVLKWCFTRPWEQFFSVSPLFYSTSWLRLTTILKLTELEGSSCARFWFWFWILLLFYPDSMFISFWQGYNILVGTLRIILFCHFLLAVRLSKKVDVAGNREMIRCRIRFSLFHIRLLPKIFLPAPLW